MIILNGSRNTKPAKPLKGKNVSAVYLYVPPEVKNFWYQFYEDSFKKSDAKPSISEFLGGILNLHITTNAETDSRVLTITCTGPDFEYWNKVRLEESPDPEDVQSWDEFITSKMNAGINLFDEIQTAAPETGKLEAKILEISLDNVNLLQRVSDLKEQLKRKETMDLRNVLKDSLINIIATSDKPLKYVDIRQELNKMGVSYNSDAVYPALTDLVGDDIIKMDVKGTSEYFLKI